MGVESKHPQWEERAQEWLLLRHCARGETSVKTEADTYLPKPSGFAAQKDGGAAMYAGYSTRAQFPELLAPTVNGTVGVIHRTEAQIEMPDALIPLWERATKEGLPLEAFHRRITTELVLTGRFAILVDAPLAADGGGLPFMVGYPTEALINWADDRSLFVLDESGVRLEDFDHKPFKRHRVLRADKTGYSQQVYDDAAPDGGAAIRPTARANGPVPEIPFVVMGAKDLAVAPGDAPLIGVARAALAIYRLDADYRHQLYMSGQETLVFIGVDDDSLPLAIGAGVLVSIAAGGDAKYVGPSGSGIDAHRVAIQDERANAVQSGARLFDATDRRAAESGEALRLRYAAQTATLTSVAQASAQGLEKALRYAAIMIGADPTQVIVKPNLKFVDSVMTPEQAEKLVAVWQSGAISKLTMYENLQRGEIASAERTLEDEEKVIAEEGIVAGIPAVVESVSQQNPA